MSNPHFPALRSGPTAVSGASRQKQFSSSPESLARQHELDLEFYEKWLSAGGIPLLASGKVDDAALAEGRDLILSVRAGRDELREAMAKEGIWAEGLQSWFDCNRDKIVFTDPDGRRTPIRTREDLQTHLPELAALLKESLGENPWRYTATETRAAEAHLVGFDRTIAPTFSWPAEVIAAFEEEEARRNKK